MGNCISQNDGVVQPVYGKPQQSFFDQASKAVNGFN
jgi:hypothetical protein